jgi:hypothetical protein
MEKMTKYWKRGIIEVFQIEEESGWKEKVNE